jgi:hypothetical protein
VARDRQPVCIDRRDDRADFDHELFGSHTQVFLQAQKKKKKKKSEFFKIYFVVVCVGGACRGEKFSLVTE